MEQTASGIMLANDMADVRTYAKNVNDRLVGGTAHGRGVGNKLGDALDVLAYLANLSSGGRNLYVPNGVDVWGAFGNSAFVSALANTSTYAAVREFNISAGGFNARAASSGTFVYKGFANQVVGRPAVMTATTVAVGSEALLYGATADGGGPRPFLPPVAYLPGGYTSIQMEAVVSLSALNGSNFFLGWNHLYSVDPCAATAGYYSAGIAKLTGTTDWVLLGNVNGVVTTTVIVAAAALTAYWLKVTFDGTTLSGTVNATSNTKATGLPTTTQLMASGSSSAAARCGQFGTAVTNVRNDIEYCVERLI